jgi:mRNA interferase MazF
VIVQADEMIRFGFSSVVVRPMTMTISDRPTVRVGVQPDPANGLSERSEVMVEKLAGMATRKVRRIIGHLDRATMADIDRALFVVLGLGRVQP